MTTHAADLAALPLGTIIQGAHRRAGQLERFDEAT